MTGAPARLFATCGRLNKALEKAGKSVKLVEFKNRGHSEWSTKNGIQQIEEAIAFLKPVLQ
ncbi:MAG: hypothetical protein ACT4UQ_07765 [Gammaproteobacteria bacterium]